MPEYFTPGVYVEEYDNSPRSIEGVGTSTAGFVGMAEKGPVVGAPRLVTSFKSFRQQFGGFLSEFTYGPYRHLAASVEQFFVNGGTRCFVMRVAPKDAECAEKEMGLVTFKAKNPGKWGNKIQITLTKVSKQKLQLIGKSDVGFIAKKTEGFREGDVVEFDGKYYGIETIIDNTIVFDEAVPDSAIDTNAIPKKVLYEVKFNLGVRVGDEAENYEGLSLNNKAPEFIGTKVAGSDIIEVEVAEDDKAQSPIEAILGEDTDGGSFLLEGGSDGNISKINAGTFLGEDAAPGQRTGLASFVENTMVSMLAIPGVTIPDVVVGLVNQCENLKDRFAIIDMPEDAVKTEDLIKYRGMIDSTYAAMYHPWIQVFDRASSKPGFIPPSGAVAGVYSRTDIGRGVHKAPANETVFCTGLKTNYTKDEQDILNPEGINLIRALPGQGIRVWGARTASNNSTFKYVNVRRLFIFVEESIKANTNWVVFEPNDATLWQRVNLTISSFLEGLWRNGMLSGASPSEGYFVEIGPSTMTRDDIMNGRLICNVGIAPSRPAEFVIFRVTQHTAEAAGGGEEA